MKRFGFSIILLLLVSPYFNMYAQTPAGPTPGAPPGAGPPAGGSDKNLSDNLGKLRSVELERIKREAAANASSPSATINTKIESKFPEIKEDFESIQIAQEAIIKAYTTDKSINYALIETSAETIYKNAKRLDTNVFAESPKKKEKAAAEKIAVEKMPAVEEKPKSMRDLIVELDNAIGSFVSSKIFGNSKVVDPEVAAKARNDLTMIQQLSEKLSAEAKKLKQ